MILRIPAYNNIGVCKRCWASATPHNGRGLLQTPYLRVAYCSHNDALGDRLQSPMLRGDRFVLDGVRFEVTSATVERDTLPENADVSGHAWVWVLEVEQDAA